MSDKIEAATNLISAGNEAFARIESYSCLIHCHERIKNKRKMRKPERIFSYFKKPNSVYLRWERGPYQGLQASCVPHRDGADRFQARETGLKGLAGATKWPHDSPIIDKAYPHYFQVRETSIKYLMELSGGIMEKAIDLGKFDVAQIEEVTDKLVRRPATKLLCRLSSSPADGLRWLETAFFYDHETELPLHFMLYDFDGELAGDYAFTEFKADVPLTDADFVLKKR